jgi:hypothetical protein
MRKSLQKVEIGMTAMWYGVNIFMKGSSPTAISSDALWEESVFLIQANSESEAKVKAEDIAKQGECRYMSATNELIEWTFATVARVYPIEVANLDSGTEVFSRFLRPSEAESLLIPFDERSGSEP